MRGTSLFVDNLLTNYYYRIPSKYGCFKAYRDVSRSLGSIFRSDLRKFKALGVSFPKYLFSIESKVVISGNFIPRNLGFFRNVSY